MEDSMKGKGIGELLDLAADAIERLSAVSGFRLAYYREMAAKLRSMSKECEVAVDPGKITSYPEDFAKAYEEINDKLGTVGNPAQDFVDKQKAAETPSATSNAPARPRDRNKKKEGA